MLPNINPIQTEAWKALEDNFTGTVSRPIKQLFVDDKNRFADFSIRWEDWIFDYSKNNIDSSCRETLVALARETHVSEAIELMFTGDKINGTEDRSVLHTALRNFSDTPVYSDGEDVMPGIKTVRKQMKKFCEKLHNGDWRGYTGKKIKYIVNIGIGGSDLGPVMVTEALKPWWVKGIQPLFVSNIDGTHLAEALKEIAPEQTLFLIASKTFTTQETMTNAASAKKWLLKAGAGKKDIAKHFVALSTNAEAVTAFGIDEENMFPFWDWVGGRYSLWSAIGLSIALTIGYENFEKLLKGAESADNHFRYSMPMQNIPLLMALVGIWNRNFCGYPTEAILPYDQYLHRFPAYFQQGNMESNGKHVDRNGNIVMYETGPVIWGEPGTNGQHAFYQLIHQGTEIVPCDFIAPAISQNPMGDHHDILLSNFFAQTEALMNGQVHENPYRVFEGNRPTNSFLVREIKPYTLGQLIALYEHKIFVQGVIWNIYSFDQWGVELGKKLAGNVLKTLEGIEDATNHDSSTNGLINAYKKWKANEG